MKKYALPIVAIGFFFCSMQAQNLNLVRLVTQEDLSGNARFEAMSGAFGGLGGNLSSLHINPAGAAVFSTNKFGMTYVLHHHLKLARLLLKFDLQKVEFHTCCDPNTFIFTSSR